MEKIDFTQDFEKMIIDIGVIILKKIKMNYIF